jgi:hypothetical protein
MQISGPIPGGAIDGPAFALGADTARIITKLASLKEARLLPCGSVVGDLHGGLTFNDQVAAELERRSLGGWQERQVPSGEVWTYIVVNR